MTQKNPQPERTFHTAKEIEQMLLPKTHARKHREAVMKDPVKFGEHLKDTLMKSIRKKRQTEE
jgi:hypothetical protein